MTDLEKAKQEYREWRHNSRNVILGPIGNVDEIATAAAYASHSNSELLERVQKLEQALGLCITELERHRADGYRGWREAHDTAVELLAKAPDTRNV